MDYEYYKDRAERLQELLENCMSTMDDCYAYYTNSYREASEYLYGNDEEEN